MLKKIVTSYKGRKCKHHGCKHILSIYNHEAYCRIHAGYYLYQEQVKKDGRKRY